MRYPRPPQDWEKDIEWELFSEPKVRDFIENANREYWNWDEVRRHPIPKGLSDLKIWAMVKVSRATGRRFLPLHDVGGVAFSFVLPNESFRMIHEIDTRGNEWFSKRDWENRDAESMRTRFWMESLMEESIASSQIEGAVTTRVVAKEMLRTGRNPKDKSERMILNGYLTMRLLSQRIDKPMSLELLHEIHSSISRDTLENPGDLGAFRKTDDIGVVDERDNEVMHVPPKAVDLPGRIDKMIEFANEENQEGRPFIHPLVRAAILHFWLAYEHPYVDGNGRTARALFYWKMLRGGYNLFRYLTISRIINDARMKYYRAFLNSERDGNDLTYFILHQFDATRRAIDQLRENVDRKQAEKQELERTLSVPGLNVRQLAIIHRAIKNPKQIFTFQSHRESHGISLQTARTDILELVERGFLVDRNMRYPRQFVPAKDILSHIDPRV